MIREATLADVPALVVMGERFRASTRYAETVAANPDQMRETATKLIAGGLGIVFVATDASGETLTGMIGLVAFPHFLSGVWTVSEAFWWSEQPGQGVRLLHMALKWAEAQGARKVQMIQPIGIGRVGDLYARLGFRAIEVAWEKDLAA